MKLGNGGAAVIQNPDASTPRNRGLLERCTETVIDRSLQKFGSHPLTSPGRHTAAHTVVLVVLDGPTETVRAHWTR